MFNKKKDRFSIRKFKVGVGSVFLGSFLIVGPQVFAEASEVIESVPKSSVVDFELSSVEKVTVSENTTVVEEASLSTAELKEDGSEKVTNQEESAVTEVNPITEEVNRSSEQLGEKVEETISVDKLTLEVFKKLSVAEVKLLTEEHFRQLNLSDEDVAGLSLELTKALTSSRAYQRYNRSRGEMPEGTGFRADSNAVPAGFTAVGNEGDLRKSTNNQFVVAGTSIITGRTEAQIDTVRNQAGAYVGSFQATGIPANTKVKFNLISAIDGRTLIEGPEVTANQNGVANWSYSNTDPAKPILAGYVTATYSSGGTQHEFRYKVDYPKPVIGANDAHPEVLKYLNGYDKKTIKNADFTRNGGLNPGGVQIAHIARNAKIEYIVQTPDGKEEVVAEGQNGKTMDGKPAPQFPDNVANTPGTNGINADAGPGNISYGWGPKLEFKKPLPLSGKFYARVTMKQADGDIVVTGPKYDITTAPRIAAPTSVNPFNAATDKTLSGTGMANQTIRIIIPGVDKPKYAIVDGSGNWSLKEEGTASMFNAEFASGDNVGAGRDDFNDSKGTWVNRDILTSADIAAIRAAVANGEEIKIIQQPNMWPDNSNLAGRFWSLGYGANTAVRYRASANDDGTGDDGRPSTGHLKLVVNQVPQVESTREVQQFSELPTESDKLRDLIVSNPNELPTGTTFVWATKPSTNSLGEQSGVVTVTYPNGTSQTINLKVNVVDTVPPAEPSLRPQPDGSVVISTPEDAKRLVVTVADGTPVEFVKDNQGNWSLANGQGVPTGYATANGKLLVPSTNNQTVTAIVKDEAGNSSTPDKVKANDQITAAKAEIEAAKVKKNQAIDANQDMTQTEKTTAKQAVEKAANDAIKALDKKAEVDKNAALTSDSVDFTAVGTEKQKGLDAIEAVPLLAKDKANQEIDVAAATRKTAINATPNATQADKEAAIKKVDAAVEKAKAAITAATTPDAVNAAKDAGKTAIEAVEAAVAPAAQKDPLEAAKETAKQHLKAEADKKIKEITASDILSPEEKVRAINNVNKVVEEGNKAIDATQNQDAATDAGSDAEARIEDIGSVGRDKARKAIDDAAAIKKAAIDANPALTTEEKNAEKAKVDAAVTAAKTAINRGRNQNEINTAKDTGVNTINAITPVPVKKDAAKAKVEEAKRIKEQAIDNNNHLTAEEKQAAKEKVAAEADKANKVIDAATSNQDVATAQTAGEKAVRDVPETAAKKAEAKAAIDKVAADRKLELALRTNLSPEEKEAVLADVEAAATAEKEKVDQATNDAGVEAAKTAGENVVKAVDKVGKDQAKAAIDAAKKAKDKEIDDNKDLTAEEKQAAKEQTKQKADEAKQAIDNATNKTGVDTAKTDGEAALAGVAPTADKKKDAKQAIEAKATEAKDAIDQNQNLSQAEKDAKKAEVEAEANKAKDAIDAATNNAEVDKAKTDGEAAVNDIQIVGKENALKAIDDAAAEKEKAINDNADLTAEEKAKAKEAVSQAAKDEKQKVNDAITQDAVTAAQAAGVKAVNDVEVTPAKKKDAKAAIDEKLKEKENLINDATGLTEDEKTAAKEEAKKLAKEAKEAIDAATTDAAVDKAKTNGTGEIEKVSPNAVTKPEATKAIDEAKAAKDQEIDGNKDLTDEEKQAAKEKVQQAADEAKQAIADATTNDAVTNAKTNGLNALNDVPQTSEIKATAKNSIDNAKLQKEQEVDMRSDLTDEEKAAAKAELANKAQEAKNAIDAATTNDAVGDALNENLPYYNNFAPKPVQKEAAKAKVEEVAKAKEAAIDKNTQATDEEKVAAKQKVQEEATKAKQAIDAATTNANVIAKKDDGIVAINGVDVAPKAKEAAKKAIDKAAETKKAELVANPDLSTEEKLAAIQKVDEAAKAAKEAIDEAETNTTVDTETANGVKAINADTVAKDKQKAEIEKAAADKIAVINADDKATQEEKEAAIKAVNDAKKEALQAIEDADAADQVTEAVTDGKQKIKDVEVSHATADAVEAALAKAETEINKAADAKKDEIANNDALSDAEKEAAKKQVDDAAKEAKEKANAATTPEEADQAVESGKTAIDDIAPIGKDKAKDAIDKAKEAKDKEIDADKALTEEEKAKAKADVEKAVADAKKAIDDAMDNDGVDTAKTEGETAVTGVQPAAAKKQAAKDVIDKAKEAKDKEIDANKALTEEEKAKAKEEAQKAADEAKAKVDEAATNEDVANVRAEAEDKIEKLQPTATAKDDAKAAIAEKAKEAAESIDQNNDLSEAEKAAAKAEIAEKAEEANKAIDAATDQAAVDTAKDDGKTAIDGIAPIAKDKEKDAIDAKAVEKKNAIEGDNNLTAEEKQAAQAEVDAAANAAKAEIDKATDKAAVDQAKAAGEKAIEAVTGTASTKRDAKAAIDKAKEAKDKEIDANTALTDEEKAEAKKEVAKAAGDAKAAIEAATTDKAVADEKTKAIKAIDEVSPSAVSKDDAKAAIDAAADVKKARIEANPILTTEEKEAEKAKVDAEVTKAKDAIDAAATNQAVIDAKAAGINAIDSVTPDTTAKADAKAAIDKAKEAKDKEIDADTALTDEEKVVAKAAVEAAATKAKVAIDAATDKDGVDTAKTDGETAVNDVQPTAAKKQAAKDTLDAVADVKKAAIDANTALTTEEKEAAKAKVDEAVTAAKESIDTATTNAVVDTAKAEGVTAIKDVPVTATVKDQARKAIDEAAKAKKAEIKAKDDLSADEKLSAVEDVDTAANKAKEAINAAETDEAVNTAANNGKAEIEAINPVAKDASKVAIDEAAKAKKEEIANNNTLSEAEKATANKQVDDAVVAAKAKVEAATTPEEVTAAANEGKDAIESVKPVGKDASKAAIDEAAKAKKEEIANNNTLSEAEKATANKQVDDAAEAAKEKVDEATTPEEVTAAANEGKDAIESVKPVGKDEAKAAIDEAAKAKKEEITNNNTLSEAEKAAANKQVDDAVTAAKEKVEAATTPEEVTAAVNGGKDAIESVKPVGKDEAKAAIDEAAKAKKEEIANNNTLSEAEKAAANKQVDDAVTAAKEKVEAATTETEVKEILGSTSLVVLPIEKLPVANINQLTTAEQERLVKELTRFNPNATITVGENGKIFADNFEIPITDLVVQGRHELGLADFNDKPILKLNADDDNDGLTNLEELQLGTDSFNKDTDGDGVDDGTEVKKGTNPLDANSYPVSDNQANSETKVDKNNVGDADSQNNTAKSISDKKLPTTGESNSMTSWNTATLSLLISLGLVVARRKKDEEA
ncbi:DUF1542 domain-containing protein [Carnobacteriaceae bacterium zg-84]|uniref:DUF1542 domain-containing protein n=1 Tax=Granulicatella sp. zg-84 TaxID=2678503 RepID=UPI0013C2032D|nr:DUF1542 domain-containing protein [Granulicatella sp. zg-84]NEW66076.1 DUF1542 domain-containing protein [Granulicatella sp. zg-84]QMI86606.1 DUF1542 domain-containing protein [Carnobacteriaceae bacterium zg-84]